MRGNPSKSLAHTLSKTSDTTDDQYRSKSNGTESATGLKANMVNGSTTDLVLIEPDIGKLVEGKLTWTLSYINHNSSASKI